jgi:filamentous hemagglutinin
MNSDLEMPRSRAGRDKSLSSSVKVATQAQLASLQAAVRQVLASGVKYDQLIRVGGWELKFGAPPNAGQLPVLFHALMVK